MDIGVTTVLLIVFSLMLCFCKINYNRTINRSVETEEYYVKKDAEKWVISSLAILFTIGVVLFCGAAASSKVFSGFYNPEYVAINMILDKIKG